MLSPQHIIDIAKTRLQEAEILRDKALYDGAFYLAGYSVELGFKAKICTLLDIPNFYDRSFTGFAKVLGAFKTHKFDELLLLSGLRTKFEAAKSNDVSLYTNWTLVSEKWSEECRYMCCGTKTSTEVQELINAIAHAQTGILPWILNN